MSNVETTTNLERRMHFLENEVRNFTMAFEGLADRFDTLREQVEHDLAFFERDKIDVLEASLIETQDKLNKTQRKLNETQGRLNETQGRINETQDNLNDTLTRLNETQTDLNELRSDLTMIINAS
jgi:chromosome segregation ATPase